MRGKLASWEVGQEDVVCLWPGALSPWSMRGQLSGLNGFLTRGWCWGYLGEGNAAVSKWEDT